MDVTIYAHEQKDVTHRTMIINPDFSWLRVDMGEPLGVSFLSINLSRDPDSLRFLNRLRAAVDEACKWVWQETPRQEHGE